MIGKDKAGRNIYGKTWYIRYTDLAGKRVMKSVPGARSKREADRELERIKTEIREARERGLQPRVDPELTLGEVIDAYLNYAKSHLRTGDRLPTTARALLKFFGPERKAISISKADVEAFIKWRRETPKERQSGKSADSTKTVKPATINRELALLQTAYNHAIQNQLLERNPVALVKKLKENNVRDRIITEEEYQKLLDQSSEHLKLIIMTAYETGMRRGEIENLKWDRVDLEAGFINLRPEDTKTEEGRRVPMPSHLLEKYRALRNSQASQTVDINTGAYVFRYQDNNGVYRHGQRTKIGFDNAKRRAGIKNFRFHDLRHTFVTRMRDKGVPDRVIMAITGHRTMSTFMRYDKGPGEDQLRAAIEHCESNGGKNGSKVVAIEDDGFSGE